ncbi:MAG: AcrR family transcriptional regulator [Granulosicoccus sp.]|jgi:AcrR family transcriptional regulator
MSVVETEHIRAPQQARSQRRVEQILDSAKALILEHGYAGLKMTGIASTAGITISSIYQYFPNKHAIVAGLAQHYLDINHQGVAEVLSTPPADLDELSNIGISLLDVYYTMHREDPVVRDVWMGMASNKEFKAIDDADTQKNLDLIFNRTKHLFKPHSHRKVKLVLHFHIKVVATSVAIAVELDKTQGRQVIEMAKTMLRASTESALRPLCR